MAIQVTRDRAHKMKHVVQVRRHAFAVDEPASNGGEDLGVTPHEATTAHWHPRPDVTAAPSFRAALRSGIRVKPRTPGRAPS
jgi:hypothetical protein